MNKKCSMDITVLIKWSLFQETIENLKTTKKQLIIVTNQEQIDVSYLNIKQSKIYLTNFESINYLRDLALAVIQNGQSHSRCKQGLLDPITCFNLFLLEERKAKEIFYVKPDSKIKKYYVYFTFYRVLMAIEPDQDETKKVVLREVDITKEINSKIYL